MSLQETPKFDKNDCIKQFTEHLIQGSGPENFRRFSLNGELDKYHVRGMAWKIFMDILPDTETLDQWIETLNNLRNEYKKKEKKFLKPQKFSGDPLGGMVAQNTNNETWKTYYIDNDTKKLINLDLDRTFQEIALFHDQKIKNNLANILFIWNKENQDVGYQQGMNDILSVIFLAIYPCYFKKTSKKTINELMNIANEQLTAINNSQDLYEFFHDEDELYSDLYYCYSKLMSRGLKELFDSNISNKEKQEISFKKYELFSNQWVHDPSDDIQNPLNIRCTMIIKEKLKAIDPELFQHFQRIGLNCGIFLQRWLKCIFDREFELQEVLLIWDAIFATTDSKDGYGLIFIDYFTLAMILRIRDELLQSDQNECFMTLFKYPHVEKIPELIIFANQLQKAIEDKVSGRKSEFLEKIVGVGNSNNNGNNVQNNNESHEDSKVGGLLKNAMNSMGGFLSNMKNKFKKEDNNNNENGQINVNVGYTIAPIKSVQDSAKRLNDLYHKYHSMMNASDDKELADVIQYLYSYK